jgi:hypothetical protein
MKNRNIANIENTFGRRATLIAITPLAALLVLLVGTGLLIFTGVKALWREWGYVVVQNAEVVRRGYTFAWMGKGAYYKMVDEKQNEKIRRMFPHNA